MPKKKNSEEFIVTVGDLICSKTGATGLITKVDSPDDIYIEWNSGNSTRIMSHIHIKVFIETGKWTINKVKSTG